MLGLGFVLIAVALVLWGSWALGRASAACGDAPGATRRLRARFLLVAAGWMAAWLLVAASGVLTRWDLRPPPPAFMVLGVLLGGVALARSAAGERVARGLSLAALVAVQGFRLPLELLMHEAAERGVMPVQMSYTGWNFDIVTGITALVLAAWLRWGAPPRAIVVAWNVMGLALLAAIVTIAVLSMPVFAVFGTTADRLNTFVAEPPFVLLPTVMVLAAWAGHLLVFRALASPRRASTPGPR